MSRTVEMEKCRLQGMTYAEIGEKFGISKQRVAQILGKHDPRYFQSYGKDSCVFSGLRKWLNERKISRKEFGELIYQSKISQNTYSLVSLKLRGKDELKMWEINRIIEITGKTYEWLFLEDVENDIS